MAAVIAGVVLFTLQLGYNITTGILATGIVILFLAALGAAVGWSRGLAGTLTGASPRQPSGPRITAMG